MEQKSPTEPWAMLYVKCNWILPPYSRQDDEFGVKKNNWTLHFVQGDECVPASALRYKVGALRRAQ